MSEPDPKVWARRILKALGIEDKRVTQVLIEVTAESVSIQTLREPVTADLENLERELEELNGE